MDSYNLLFSKEFLIINIERLRSDDSNTVYEPIPYYTEKEIDELYNCIRRSYETSHIHTAFERIATVMYNIVKTHYLSNGNKRIAAIVTRLLVSDIGQTNIDIDDNKLKYLILKIADNTIFTKEDAITEFEPLLIQII